MKIKPVFFGAAILTAAIINANADNMAPPAPLQNKILDSMVGEWKGDSNMMGTPMHDKLKIEWALNHQFLIMKLKSESTQGPKNEYEGMGVFGVDSKGNAKTWWFDNWGANAVSTGTGKFSNNQVVINDGNTMFKEVRTFTVQGDQMTMHAKGSMTMNGKTTPFDNTTVYKK